MCEDVGQTVSLRSVRIVFSSEERMRSATRVNTPTDLKRVDNRLSLLSAGATLSYAESSALLALLDVSSVSSEYLVLPADDEDEDDEDVDDDDEDLDDDDDDLDDDDEAGDEDDEDLEDDDFEGDDDDLEDDDLEEEDDE
jgi:hypothetical protein